MTLRGLLTVRRKGGVYHYLRIAGRPLVRLPDLPLDHPDFLRAYADAMGAVPVQGKPLPGSISALCDAALLSPAFRGFSASYKLVITRHVEAIRDKGGKARASDLRARHIEADLNALAPSVAQSRHKAWRFICGQGKASGLLAEDVSATVPHPRLNSGEGYPAWTREDVEKFRTRWPIGTVQRALFELLHWTGVRISDAVRIGPGMVDATGVLSFRQTKTGGVAFVPWTCALPAYAASLADDRRIMHDAIACLSGHLLFIHAKGRARSANAIGGDVRASARAAGVEKSAHGLRKTRAYSLADAGATTHQIGAWTGHETLAEIAHYTARADRRRAVMGTEQDANGEKLQSEVKNSQK